MTDLTPLFVQCIDIVLHDLKNEPTVDFDLKINREKSSTRPKIDDTFFKECKELYEAVVGINVFIDEIRSVYLSTNIEGGENTTLTLSNYDKNQIDQEVNIKIQQIFDKFKVLQSYELERQKKRTKGKKNWFDGMFGEVVKSEIELFHDSIAIYREHILKFLSIAISKMSKNCESLQRKRLERQKQMNLLNFQNFQEDEEINYNEQNFEQLENLDIQQEGEFISNELTQQQIVELETENADFLSFKTDQLKHVAALHSSMVDIINLQAEISFQLEQQDDKISNLMDNQAQVEIDIAEGNKNLSKATKRNKKGANFLVSTCIILGIIVLLLDYISY